MEPRAGLKPATFRFVAGRAILLRQRGIYAPDRARTCDPLLVRQMLIPTELLVQSASAGIRTQNPLIKSQVQ